IRTSITSAKPKARCLWFMYIFQFKKAEIILPSQGPKATYPGRCHQEFIRDSRDLGGYFLINSTKESELFSKKSATETKPTKRLPKKSFFDREYIDIRRHVQNRALGILSA